MKAYRLESNKELEIVNNTWLYDIDEDFISKKSYIARAKKLTEKANKEFNANYTWIQLFGEPFDCGYRYCPYCKTYYWQGEECECDSG